MYLLLEIPDLSGNNGIVLKLYYRGFQNFTKDLPNKIAEHPQTLKALNTIAIQMKIKS